MSEAPRDEQDRLAPEIGESDDAVIGRALKLSLIIGGLALALVVLAVVLRGGAPEPEAVEEAVVRSPRIAAEAVEVRAPDVAFRDITAAAGIDFVHTSGAYGESFLPETMGGGVAFVDFDGDGHQDLVFVDSGHWPWSDAPPRPALALYRNRGDGSFENVTAGSGADASLFGMGIAVGDYDGDGRVDLFVTAVDANRLLRNLGGGRFEDVTSGAGVAGADDAWSTSAAFFDYDRDGDLDLFVANYVRWTREIDLEVDYRLAGIGRAHGPPTNYAGTNAYLYRNDGEDGFADVSAEAGIEVSNPATGEPVGKGLAVRPLDVDDDGWLDLIVANDTVANFLFRNLSDGRFEEVGSGWGVAFDNAGAATGAMGIDATRYNDDADLAVAIGNFANEMSSFYVATGRSALFTDETIVAGVGPESRRALSFGLFFFDYDLDGRVDLLQANGHVEDEINIVQPSQEYAQPPQLFWNCGVDCPRHFVRVADASLGDFARPLVGRGAAYADIDADGDLDVVLTQVGGAPALLRNEQQTGHHWLRLRLRGGERNPDAIGARVTVAAGGRQQTRWVMPARSYLSQVELPLTFGLGEAARVEQVRVVWPDGTTQEVAVPAVDAEQVVDRAVPVGG